MLTMGQLVNVLLATDKAHPVSQRALDCRPGLGQLNRFMGPIISLLPLRISIANIATSLHDVQIGISLIF